jgi:hypothetical protein
MKNHVNCFNSFVNEMYGYYDPDKPRKLRKHLVGGKGQKAQYDALSDYDRSYLEVDFEMLGNISPDIAKHFIGSLSKYNSIEELQRALSSYISSAEGSNDTGWGSERGY